jgi:hypothetical protein
METIIIQDIDQTVLEMLTAALEMDNFEGYPLMSFEIFFWALLISSGPTLLC